MFLGINLSSIAQHFSYEVRAAGHDNFYFVLQEKVHFTNDI